MEPRTIVAILVVTILVLTGIIFWLLWHTLKIRTSITTMDENGQASRRVRRMSAEVFMETYRGKGRELDEAQRRD